MDKVAKSNLCKIFYRRKDEEKSVFGCGCLVKCSDQSLKIATSTKIRELTPGDEVFATFVASQEEVKLQVHTGEESEETGIAYVSFDETALTHRPDGLSMGNVRGIDQIACLVPVMENLERLGGASSNMASKIELYDVVRDKGICTLKHQTRVISNTFDSNKFHLLVLGAPIFGAPIFGANSFEFLGIIDSMRAEDDEASLFELVYHGEYRRVSTVVHNQPTLHPVSPQGAGPQTATTEAEIHIKCIICGSSSLSASANLAFKYSGGKLQDLKNLVQEVVLPFGAYVRDVIFGSVTFVVIVTTLEALEEIWKRYKNDKLKHDLAEKVFCIAQDQHGMDLIVEMSLNEYSKAKEGLTFALAPAIVSNSVLSTINQRDSFKNEISKVHDGSRPTPAVDRSRGIQRETTDSAHNVLSTDDPLRNLWEYINFRDAFSNVLNVKYIMCARAKYWPHLAEQFEIDQAIYDTFSTSDINSPTEALFEYLEATQPTYKVNELCEDCKKAEALEVSRFVEEKIRDGTLRSNDLVSELCNEALDVVVLKLDRDCKLWQNLARIKKIPRKKYMTFRAATANPARLFFDVLRMQGPEITVEDLKEKSRQLQLEKIPDILETFAISDETRLSGLSQRSPDAKSELESFLNNLKTDFLWQLASLYQNEGKMKDIDLEVVFRQQEDLCDPTSKMMEHVLARSRRKITIKDLIVKLWNINRKDCFDIIQPYLKGGKEDIDKITEKLKLQNQSSSEGQKQPSTSEEKNSGVPPSDVDEGNNQYVPKEISATCNISGLHI